MEYWSEVRVLKAAAPALLSDRLTSHWLLVVDSVAVALVMSLPTTLATSRANLLPALSHETICTSGLL